MNHRQAMLRRAAAIRRGGRGPPPIMVAAAVGVGGPQQQQRLPLALALVSQLSSSSSSSSSRPRGKEQQAEQEQGQALGLLEDDDEADEMEGLYRQQVALLEERAALGKALLDPAWMHGRRRISAPPQEGIERMNELSRLLSGRQIRLHASRLSRRPGGAGAQSPAAQRRAGAQQKEEDEEWDENEEEPEEEDEEPGEEEDEDGLLEGEAPQGQYYRNSALAKPSWAGRAASPPEALAYLATRAVPNFSVALRVLREAGAAAGAGGGGGWPASVLDVGCGPGSGLLAARTLWGGGREEKEGEGEQQQSRLRRLDGVDHSGAMRDLAKHLLEPSSVTHPAPPTLTLHRHLPPLVQQAARNPNGGRYDVVLASWTLSELPSDPARALAVRMMWELVDPQGGVLVLIEDGSPEGSRLVRSARRLLLEKHSGEGGDDSGDSSSNSRARTLAPCPHDRPCPLLRDDWCRFTQRVPLGRLPRGGTSGGAGSGGGGRGGGGYKDVAFSYVVLQKSGATAVGDDARLAALRRLRVDNGDDDEELQQQQRLLHAPTDADWEAATEAVPSRDGWARLIRNPKKAKGHVHLDLCLPTGKLERRVVARSAAKRLPGKYLAARKAQWGGLWPAAKEL